MLRFEELEDRTLPSVYLSIAAMGDSLTAPYAGTGHGSAGDRSWVEQFQAVKSQQVQVYNEAVGGATSSSLLSGGQHTRVANLVANGLVQEAVLIIGANDVSAHLSSIFAGNYGSFVNTVTANIETALNTVAAAGPVNLVVANIPDIGVTPSFRANVTHDPTLLQRVTDATSEANQQIEAFAASQQIPVVDLFGLSHQTLTPITFGGVEISNFYSPDNYHPSTVGQGILANTILSALHISYGVHAGHAHFTDQQILNEAGIDHPHGKTYFPVSPFVIFQPADKPADSLAPPQVDRAGATAALTNGSVDTAFSSGRWHDEGVWF